MWWLAQYLHTDERPVLHQYFMVGIWSWSLKTEYHENKMRSKDNPCTDDFTFEPFLTRSWDIFYQHLTYSFLPHSGHSLNILCTDCTHQSSVLSCVIQGIGPHSFKKSIFLLMLLLPILSTILFISRRHWLFPIIGVCREFIVFTQSINTLHEICSGQ